MEQGKKNILCFKLSLESKTLLLMESLFLELNLKGDMFKNDKKMASEDQIKGIMK